MAEKLQLDLVSPERQLVSAQVDEVYASGSEGDMGILFGHASLFCSLRTGEFRYTVDGKTAYAAVDGGFLEVMNNTVTVLADAAELGSEIDVEKVKFHKTDIEKELAKADGNRILELEEKLLQANVRLHIAEHYNKAQ